MTISATALAPIAAQMSIPASALFALPTVVEAFARKSGMTVGAMVIALLDNKELRDYAAEMCIHAEKELAE